MERLKQISLFKKILIIVLFLFTFYMGYVFIVPHTYSVDDAVSYLDDHAETHSRNMCALYVERAINAGGQPAFILPAWGYAYVLPGMGFEEIKRDNYTPKKGDVVVFPHVKGHIFGHIAMHDGKQWVSDFKQRGLFAASAYRNCEYRLFRHKECRFTAMTMLNRKYEKTPCGSGYLSVPL